MKYEANVKYSERLVKQAVFAYWKKSVGYALPAVIIFMALLAGYLIYAGNYSWLTGLVLSSVGIGAICIFALFVVHYLNSMKKLKEMAIPEAILTAETKSFTVTTSKASSTIQWSIIQEVWCYEGFWLLLFSKAQFMTIPLENIPEEMKSFLINKVEEAGGKVVC